MIRVVLVDGEELVRAGLRLVLAVAEDGDVVAEAPDGALALVEVRRHEPDVVLVDPESPGVGGLDVVRDLRQLPEPPVVVAVTGVREDEHVLATLQAGASGYLLKSCTATQLADAVRCTAAGDVVLAPAVTGAVVQRALAAPAPPDPEVTAPLSGREQEVLRHLTAGATNAEIAAQLGVGETSVKTYVSRVLAKLGVSNRVQAVLVTQQGGAPGIETTGGAGPAPGGRGEAGE